MQGTIAMYLRLSKEDGVGDESNSIANQRLLIHEYIRTNIEFASCDVFEYCDDGFSGTNMKRDALQKLLEDVKKGKIKCIIVKDMSRFSRDYIDTGDYLNYIFPFMGVRFVAINDHYDSENHKGNTFEIDTAFKTLLYDLYSKDISVKIKSSLSSQCQDGIYVFAHVPFGYQKSSDDKHKIIICEEEAKIVRYIFKLAGMGLSTVQIAKKLFEENIPTPFMMRFPERFESGEKKMWRSPQICTMLSNVFYLGDFVYNKSERKIVGKRITSQNAKEEWRVIHNHHEALISKEEFNKAMERKRKKVPRVRSGKESVLKGKVICGGCGYKVVYYHNNNNGAYRKYSCTNHATLKYSDCCTTFHADVLEEIVLTMLNEELLKKGEGVRQKKNLLYIKKEQVKKLQADLAQVKQKWSSMQDDKIKLYEEYVSGVMQRQEYAEAAEVVSHEMDTLLEVKTKLEDKISSIQRDIETIDDDMKSIIRFADLETLTKDAVDSFVKKITIYKDKRVDIEWTFN